MIQPANFRLRVRESVDLGQAIVGWLRRRLPAPVQRFGDRALPALIARWPMLAVLAGAAAADEAVPRAPLDTARRRSATTAPPQQGNDAAPATRKLAASAGPQADEPSLRELLAALERSPEWQERARAAAQLASVDAPAVVPGLLRALRDPSADAAAAVVDALAARPEPAAKRALLEVVSNGDGYFHPLTRVAAIHGVAQQLEPSDLEPVLHAVQDVSAEVSIAAIAAVTTRAPEAAQNLIHVLRDKSGFFLPAVRLAAARVLTQTGSIPPNLALQLLESEADLGVRELLSAATGASSCAL